MPALVKASPSVLAGGYALVRYSVSQTSDLTLSVEAEFVGLPFAPDSGFKLGSAPPPALRDNARFLSTLATYGSTTVPALADCQVVQSTGLKTVTANYTANIRPTSLVGSRLTITVDASGNVVLAEGDSSDTTIVGQVGGEGAGANSGGGNSDTSIEAVLAPGSALVETSVSSNWNSLSGTYADDDDESLSRSFSFDYLAYTTTIVTTGGAQASGARGGVGPFENRKGQVPRSVRPNTRETTRRYSNSRGETRFELTSIGFYSY